jgi:hypothetical protein
MRRQGYNETTVRNLQIQIKAKELLQDGKLTLPQYKDTKKAFPIDFKQGNLFVRIGLFLFTSLCIGFSMLLIMLFTGGIDRSEKGIGGLLLFFGVTLAVINEYFIRERHWYRQGSDNALCYGAILCLVASFSFMFDVKNALISTAFAMILMTLAAIRYGDPLLAFGAFYALIFCFIIGFDDFKLPFLVMPFICAALSLGVYFFSKYGLKRADCFYWEDCFKVLEIAGLFGFYAFINYQNVERMLHNAPEISIPTPFNYVFAFLTAFVPLAYLVIGIRKKERILWIMGGLGSVASILTYRLYHAIMPIEWALVLAGIALLALAIFLMKYLKTPRNGFAYQPERSKSNMIETLLVNQFLPQSPSPTEGGIKFEGGDFGGGGSSDDF